MAGDSALIPTIDTHHHIWDMINNPYPGLENPRDDTHLGDYRPMCKNYLIDDFAIIPITRTRDLIKPKPVINTKGSVVLMGNPNYQWDGVEPPAASVSIEVSEYLDPLPGTDNELKSIYELMLSNKWSPKLYTGGEAREKTLKEMYY